MISRIKKTHQKPLAAISYESTNTGKKNHNEWSPNRQLIDVKWRINCKKTNNRQKIAKSCDLNVQNGNESTEAVVNW